MAPQIYGFEGNSRTRAVETIARYEGVQLERVETNVKTQVFPEGYEKLNFNKKVPTLKDGDFVLFETIAIINYIARENKSKILGRCEKERALVLQWACWANQELSASITKWMLNYTGSIPFNKKEVDEAKKATEANFATLDKIFLEKTFLVGDRITAADIVLTTFVHRSWSTVVDPSIRNKFPNLARFVNTIMNQENYGPRTELINEAPKVPAPAKAKEAKKEEKKAAPPKEAAAPVEEAPKPPKHPLSLLPLVEPPFDDWKRFFMNNEYEDSFNWLEKNIKLGTDYTLWQADYKYPEDLKANKIFMTSNLIGGFHNRLEASRKYIFGCASAYGVDHDNTIRGVYLIRGTEYLPAFDVAPDYESYDFKKLDWNNEADRKVVKESWTGVGEVNGKKYNDAASKVYR